MKLLLINSYSLAPRSSKYFAFFFSDLSADRFVRFLWKREFNFHFELKGGGQFDTLCHQILYSLHFPLIIQIEDWNFACSPYSGLHRPRRKFNIGGYLTSIMTVMNSENTGKYAA